MCLMNFNMYDEDDTKNFQGLNTLSTLFSVLFTIFNTFIASLIFNTGMLKIVSTIVVFSFMLFSVIYTTFIFEDLTYHTTMSLAIAIIFSIIMIPAFGYIIHGIQSELSEEIRESYYQRDGFRRMFDALQEGILVFQEGKIVFMNDLSNKVLSYLADVDNFFKHNKRDKDLDKDQ